MKSRLLPSYELCIGLDQHSWLRIDSMIYISPLLSGYLAGALDCWVLQPKQDTQTDRQMRLEHYHSATRSLIKRTWELTTEMVWLYETNTKLNAHDWLQWKPTASRPRGRPRKRWLDNNTREAVERRGTTGGGAFRTVHGQTEMGRLLRWQALAWCWPVWMAEEGTLQDTRNSQLTKYRGVTKATKMLIRTRMSSVNVSKNRCFWWEFLVITRLIRGE